MCGRARHLGPDRQLPRDVPTSNMEPRSPTSKFNVRCSNIELRSRSCDFNVRSSGSNIEVRSRSLDFNVRSSGSNIEVRSRSWDFNVRCHPPPGASHPLSFYFIFSFFFFFLWFFFSTPNFEARLRCSNFELRSWNFEPRLQCSMSSPPPLLPSHLLSCLNFFSFFLFIFLLFFFSTPNFEARLQSSNFELQSWNFEPRLQCSMFPPLLSAPTTHYLFHVFFFRFLFFLFLSFVFFFPRQTSKPDFKVPTSNFEVGTSNPEFNVHCSPPPRANHPLSFLFFLFFFSITFFCFFFHAKLRSQTSVQSSNLEHLWELHGRAHPPPRRTGR